MPNHIQSQNTAAKSYDAGDMADLALTAESDMQWMSIAITDVKKRLKALKEELKTEHIHSFYAFEHVLDMYEYLAEERLNSHSTTAEKYQAEWNADKKAVAV